MGMFRYTRLMFGICSASEHFQRIIEQLLCDCPLAHNYQDDIIIAARTEEEHDQALKAVLDKLEDHNVVLNHNKCQFKVNETKFLGHNISQVGIKPNEVKIKAIQQFRTPKNAEETRSFLGLVGYVGRFIPDLATKTFELRQLMIAGDTKFAWSTKHEIAFNSLKKSLCSVPILGYFDNSKRTRVIADASPVGLGAVLVQFNDSYDNEPIIISYASKSLSPTERRYCQTEKEALAIVWSIEKFKLYLLGREFELETDHRPLTMIFKPTSQPSGRIERWVLRLQPFVFRVVYKPGKQNIADPLSRLSLSEEVEEIDQADDQLYVHAITESVAIDVSEIKAALDSDFELQLVKEAITSGIWDNEALKEHAKDYIPFQRDLSLIEGHVIRGCRLVIPRKLRPRMLQLAHEGHPGETGMVTRLRDRVWWPNMDKEARKTVKECEGCRLVSRPSAPEPMTRRKMPNEPWIDIAMDFLGPLPSGDYLLVVVDYFSRFKEVCIMRKITTEDTIKNIEPIFVRQGYPRTITLDNGRQFISSEFDHYCHVRNIKLNHTAPYWPQANGEVERQNSSLLKRLKISHALNRNWRTDLLDYLMMYNTTPHSSTGRTPTELLRRKTIRSKIPSINDIETAPSLDGEAQDRDAVRKYKGKTSEDQRRHARISDIQEGDRVLLQNLNPTHKLTTNFSPVEYIVLQKRGNRIKVVDPVSGNSYERNSAHAKRINDTTGETNVPVASSSILIDESNVPAVSSSIAPSSVPMTDAPACRPARSIQKPSWQKDYISRITSDKSP